MFWVCGARWLNRDPMSQGAIQMLRGLLTTSIKPHLPSALGLAAALLLHAGCSSQPVGEAGSFRVPSSELVVELMGSTGYRVESGGHFQVLPRRPLIRLNYQTIGSKVW